ncbi:MAG: triose-phosphate isomerase [Flavobacteriales bacterium]|jgi:triosephosphate isomerase|nr:triose-phosphate isomerase [Flavobacteriales bacterium]
MRKYILAGNWKMNTDITTGIQLSQEIVDQYPTTLENQRTILCPPYTHLFPIEKETKNTPVEVAAQNCHSEKSGAYTGEISVEMLQSLGLKTVILGHSERRSYFGETDEVLKNKVNHALSEGMEIIFCIGESEDQRENEDFLAILKSQMEQAIFQLNEEQFSNIILAYEPVWAIGTGKTASPEQAEEVHAFLRACLEEKYSKETAQNTSILYGGSCKPANANEIFSKPNVDGGLIGGAALKSTDFIALINALTTQKTTR